MIFSQKCAMKDQFHKGIISHLLILQINGTYSTIIKRLRLD